LLPSVVGAAGVATGLAAFINPRIAQLLAENGSALLCITGVLLLAVAAVASTLVGLSRRADRLSVVLDSVASGEPVGAHASSIHASHPRLAESLIRCLEHIQRETAMIDSALLTNRALARELKELGAMLDRLPVGILLLDRNQDILLATEVLAPFLTVPLHEALHQPLREVLIASVAERVFPSGEDPDVGAAIPCQLTVNNEPRHFEIRLHAAAEQGHGRLLMVFSDVTHHRVQEQHEVNVVRTVAQLVDGPLDRMEAELPYAALPEGDGAAPDSTGKALHLEIGAIRHLMRNLELLPSLQQGALLAERSSVSVERLFADVESACGRSCAVQNIDLEVIQPARAILLEGDARLLTTLISNLIFAAFQRLNPGARIRLQTSSHEDTFHIEVQDNGPNMTVRLREQLAAAQHDRAFVLERLEQGDLGLAVAFEIARLHHGTLEPGGPTDAGNTFTLRLPRTVLQGPAND
jgi:signal transduction histidine kinase